MISAAALYFAALVALPGVASARAMEAAEDVAFVVEERGALPGLDAEQTARLLIEWHAREASLRADLIGDGGRAFGALQVRRGWFAGHSAADVLGSRRLGLALGLDVMRASILRCGSVRAGLGAFATAGKCGGAPRLVARRCRQSGAC
jgi:hypothetical protein